MKPALRGFFAVALGGAVFAAAVHGQQTADPLKKAAPSAPSAGGCTQEFGVTVCRSGIPTDTAAGSSNEPAETFQAAATEPGLLLVLLDIPSDTFTRLSGDPEENRRYHTRQSWDYHPRGPAQPGAGGIVRSLQLEEPAVPAWQYRPKVSFAYHPKSSWSYDPDVFGRIWRQNILHDTRVVVVPTETAGIRLLAVQPPR